MMNIRRLSAICSLGQRKKTVSLLLAVLVMLTPSLGGTLRVHAATSVVTFTSPNAEPYGQFGYHVAVSGTSVVVGAPEETAGGFGKAGHAYIFSSTGSMIATLTSPNAQSGGEFGSSVAISGGTIVVGAQRETDGGVPAGKAYIFSTSGALIATLNSPNPQSLGFFGFSVSISGSMVVVGAPLDTVNGQSQAGNAYVFNTSGALIATLTSPSPQTSGSFGISVSISGSAVVVAASRETASRQSFAGNVYIFNTSGTLTATLTSPNPHFFGDFGFSTSISGNTVVVGARLETAGGLSQAGNAYVFNTSGALIATLTSSNPQTDGQFGTSVSMSGSTVVVGAYAETASALPQAGNVYIFSTAGGPATATLTSPNPQTSGAFGISVGVDSTNVVVGANSETAGGFLSAGHAYLFQLPPTCREADGNGDFNGSNGKGNFHADDDQCEDGIPNGVSSTNLGDGTNFQSTQISTTTFDALANTVTIAGFGTHAGVPVAFTFVALETGPTTPGWVSFAFSDGYTNAGTLVSGSILLH